jgi:hypothetical protein
MHFFMWILPARHAVCIRLLAGRAVHRGQSSLGDRCARGRRVVEVEKILESVGIPVTQCQVRPGQETRFDEGENRSVIAWGM